MRSPVPLATMLVVLASAPSAGALLKPGLTPAEFVVHDAGGKAAKFSALRSGHPTLVFYEDKDGGEQNEAFKHRLGALRTKSVSAKKVAVVAIADVSSWDFWPAKGFVNDALRSAGKRAGVTVWADWSGAGRTNLGASRDVSNILLLDGAGKVTWSSAGKLSSKQQTELLERVEKIGK